MLGFATVDLLTRDNTLTVWLTSAQGAIHAGQTNAVTFSLSDDTTSRRASGMICDRYVVLTDRTPREHPLLVGWGASGATWRCWPSKPPPRKPPSWPHSGIPHQAR